VKPAPTIPESNVGPETEDSPKQQAARDAIASFVQRPAVFLVPGSKIDAPVQVGSGIAIRTAAGRITVLTAWHVAEATIDTPHRLGYFGCDRGINDAVRGVVPGPARDRGSVCEEQIDVGLVLLSSEAERILSNLAITFDQIGDDAEVAATDVVIMAGYPFYLSFVPSSEPLSRFFAHICYTTGVEGIDIRGRLRIRWDEAITRSCDPTPPHLDVVPGKVFKLGHPGGTSGGAVWRFRGSKKGQLWSPTTDGKVIGVPVAWDTDCIEFAESCVSWRSWLRDALGEVDRAPR
jgi:hypothetical protein